MSFFVIPLGTCRDHGLSLLHAASDAVESIETEENGNSAKLSRSQSERLLSIAKEHYLKEKELKEQYHEIVSFFDCDA